MKILLSIKPEYAKKIFDGEKKYEFRRVMFKKPSVNKVIVYATSPVSAVIGEFVIDRVLYEDIKQLWDITQENSGISEEYFYRYFKGKEKGYAIKIKSYYLYPNVIDIQKGYGVKAPQSFIYVK